MKAFRPEDAALIKPRYYEREIDVGLGERAALYAATFAQHPSWTVWANDAPVFAAGFIIMWPGVAEVWARTSKWVDTHPLYFHKTVKRFLGETVRVHRLWRVQVVIPVSNQQSNHWILHLGFDWEGRCYALGPRGEDFERYARLWRENLPTCPVS